MSFKYISISFYVCVFMQLFMTCNAIAIKVVIAQKIPWKIKLNVIGVYAFFVK